MKYLGIDFGEKNIGLSVSDSSGKMAFPFKILENNKNLEKNFLEILENEKINFLVFGESLNFKGQKNEIQKKAEIFAGKISKLKKIETFWQNEVFSSSEARLQNKFSPKTKNRKADFAFGKIRKENSKKIDHSAASLILKTFLDKKIFNSEK